MIMMDAYEKINHSPAEKYFNYDYELNPNVLFEEVFPNDDHEGFIAVLAIEIDNYFGGCVEDYGDLIKILNRTDVCWLYFDELVRYCENYKPPMKILKTLFKLNRFKNFIRPKLSCISKDIFYMYVSTCRTFDVSLFIPHLLCKGYYDIVIDIIQSVNISNLYIPDCRCKCAQKSIDFIKTFPGDNQLLIKCLHAQYHNHSCVDY